MKNRTSGFGRSSVAFAVLLCMLLSIFAPTVIAAENVIPANAETETVKPGSKGELNLVTFGASNVNGFGLQGYLPDNVTDFSQKDDYNVYGYKKVPAGSYPDYLVKYFTDQGYNVDIDQLAMSSMRAEEVRVLLDNTYAGDAYTDWRFYNVPGVGDESSQDWFYGAGKLAYAELNKIDGWEQIVESGNVKHEAIAGVSFDDAFAALRQIYQQDVKNADIIVWDCGTNNFGVYLSGRVVDGDYNETIEDLDPVIAEKYNEAKVFVLNLLAEKIGQEAVEAANIEHIVDSLAYCLVAYCVNYDAVMEKIYAENPDVTVINVSIQNLMKGLVAKVPGFEDELPLGDIINAVISAANTYISVLSPYAEKSFYANVSEDQHVTFFIDQLAEYNGVPTTLDRDMINCWRIYNGGNMIADFEPFCFDENGILTVPTSGVYGLDPATTYRLQLLVIDTIAKYMQAGGDLNVLDFGCLAGGDWGTVSDTGMGAIVDAVTVEVNGFIGHIRAGGDPAKYPYVSVGENFWAELAVDKGIDVALMNTFAAYGVRTFIGNAFYAHPNRQGCKEIADIIINAYENSAKGEEAEKNALLINVRDVYFYLASNNYITTEQVFDIALYALDNEIIDIVNHAYNVLLLNNPELSDEDRIDIIKNVYGILKDDYLGAYSPAIDTVFDIYDALEADGLISAKEAFEIVDFVYEIIKDGAPDSKDIRDIVVFVYNTIFQTNITANGAHAVFSLCSGEENIVLTPADKITIINTIFEVLDNNGYMEEVPELAPVVTLYEDMKADGNISNEAIFQVIDTVVETIAEKDGLGEEEISNIATDVANKLVENENIDPVAKLAITNKIIEAVNNSNMGSVANTPVLPDISGAVEIFNVLIAKDYITKAQANQIINVLYSVLMSEESISAETVIDALSQVYDIALADLPADKKLEVVLTVYAETKKAYGFDEQDIVAFIQEYYDEALALAFIAAKDAGYVDIAIDAIGDAIVAIEAAKAEVENVAELSDALKEAVLAELDAAVATLNKVKTVLEADDMESVDELIETLYSFEDDLYTHLNNAKAILEIAGSDAADYVNEIWENNIKPEIDAILADIEENGAEYLREALKKYAPIIGEAAWNALLATPDAIRALIEFIETYGPYVEEFFEEYPVTEFIEIFGTIAVEYGIDALEYVLNLGDEGLAALKELVEMYGEEAWAIIEAYVEILGYTADARWALDYALDEIYAQIDALEELLATLEAELPNLEEALLGAVGEAQDKLNEQIEALNLKIDEIKELIAELRAEAEAILKEIAEIAEATKLVAEAIIELAKAIESGITEAIKAAIDDLKIAIDNLVSVVGEAEKLIGYLADFAERIADVADKIADGLEYIAKALAEIVVSINEITEALAELEEKLDGIAAELAKKAAEFSAKAEESANKLAECARKLADKITEAVEAIKELFENATKADYELNLGDSYYVAIGDSAVDGQYASYAEVLAELLGMKKGYNFSDFTGGELGFTIEEAIAALAANGDIIAGADLITVNYGRIAAYANINKDVANWEAILGADAAEKIEALIEYIIAEVESLIADTTIGMFIDAESLVELVETYVYAQVARMVTIHELVEKLHEIAPEALVVIVGAYNEFDGVVIEIADNEIALGEYFAAVTDIINASFYACALFNEQTIFVSTDGIETQVQANGGKITTDDMSELVNLFMNPTELKNYFVPSEAGNVDIANRILAALNIVVKDHEHVYGYVCDATCNLCGAVRGVVHTYDNACDNDCNFCGTTRVVGDHVYSAACDANCDICGAVRTNAAAHNFGAWQTVRQPSYNVMGIKTRTCADCGYVQAGIIDVLVLGEAEEEAPVGLIVGITIPSVIALAAGGFSIYWFAYKKKSFKDLANVFAKMLAKFKK